MYNQQDLLLQRTRLRLAASGPQTVDNSQVTFHASGRNMTVSIPAHDILIRFRFTGHHRVKENFHGISTFTEPLWLADYRYTVISTCFRLLDWAYTGTARPSAIVPGQE